MRSRTSVDLVRIGGVAAEDEQRDLRAGRAAQQPRAFVRRHVARGLVVDGADEVTGAQAGLRGRRSFARRDDAQVVLTDQFDADVRGPGARVAFDGAHQIRRQEGAVGVERFGQAAHRAAHRLLQVDFLDVVVDDVRDDIIEDPQVLIGVVLRHRLAQIAAHEREHDDRRRDGENPQAGARCHQELRCRWHYRGFSHCTGSIGLPSIRSSK